MFPPAERRLEGQAVLDLYQEQCGDEVLEHWRPYRTQAHAQRLPVSVDYKRSACRRTTFRISADTTGSLDTIAAANAQYEPRVCANVMA